MSLFFAILLTIILVGSNSWSYDAGYSPGFEPFSSVKLFAVQSCPRIASNDAAKDIFSFKETDGTTWRIEMQRSQNLTLSLILPGGRLITMQIMPPIRPYLEEVYTGDFNSDKKLDFAAVIPAGGNGLASEYCYVAFFLSRDKGYKTNFLSTMGFGPEDFIDYYGDNRCQIVHTSFIYGEVGKDGRTHNYWVHHFLEIDGADMFLSKRILPRWIMYAGTSNHKDTQQLTAGQKKRLWDEQKRQIFLQ